MSSPVRSVLDESSSFLQVTRTTKSMNEFDFCQIPPPITEVAALERLKNECIML